MGSFYDKWSNIEGEGEYSIGESYSEVDSLNIKVRCLLTASSLHLSFSEFQEVKEGMLRCGNFYIYYSAGKEGHKVNFLCTKAKDQATA